MRLFPLYGEDVASMVSHELSVLDAKGLRMAETASHAADGVRQKRRKRDIVRGLFDDLSVAQVLAGALAAVTSMLLASQIGIYGSVIGVGVGSVISAVASQLYKKFLSASADKIREVGGHDDDGECDDRPTGEGREGPAADSAQANAFLRAETAVLPAVGGRAETAALPVAVDGAETAILPAVGGVKAAAPRTTPQGVQAAMQPAASQGAETVALPAVGGQTVLMPAVDGGAKTTALPVEGGGVQGAASQNAPASGAQGGRAARDDAGIYADEARIRAKAARQRKARMQQRVLLVSVASAIAAVILCAVVISIATGGQGMGEKPQHFVSAGQNAVVQDEQGPDPSSSASQDEAGSNASQDEGGAHNDASQTENSSSGSGESSSSGPGLSGSAGESSGSSSGGSASDAGSGSDSGASDNENASSGSSGESSTGSGSQTGDGSGSQSSSGSQGGSGESGSGSSDDTSAGSGQSDASSGASSSASGS